MIGNRTVEQMMDCIMLVGEWEWENRKASDIIRDILAYFSKAIEQDIQLAYIWEDITFDHLHMKYPKVSEALDIVARYTGSRMHYRNAQVSFMRVMQGDVVGYLDTLLNKSKDELINDAFNARVAQWVDRDEEKRIPYIGWFWRYPDFLNKRVCIGDCGKFIGVMENNKWGYPSRFMTEQEVDTFISYLDLAFTEMDKGGNVSENEARAEKIFKELWIWFQTLTIKGQIDPDK